jgi:phosphoadenosine phosphosulfate reductase
MSVLDETLATLKKSRERSKSILVSYSGGKDSLAVLDMCARTFDHVEGLFMYLVPGLEVAERQLEYGRKRWGLKIHQLPHWVYFKAIKAGIYCLNHHSTDEMPDWTLRDVYDVAKADTKIPLIAHGAKRSDSQWRKRWLANTAKTQKYDDVIYPVLAWNKADVLSYLKAQSIPIPTMSFGQASGIDLSAPALLYIHDNYPDDFKRICEAFPFAEAVVWRRKFHGV